jgi:NADH dehydrogenase FAD-containing subunit
VRVQPDLSVPGSPEVFVLGDTASFDQEGHALPGVAQVAIQQGRYAGRLIARRIVGKPVPAPFHYFDKGNMAVVGGGFAVLQTGKVRMHGFLEWLAWGLVHQAGSRERKRLPASHSHRSGLDLYGSDRAQRSQRQYLHRKIRSGNSTRPAGGTRWPDAP